MWPCLPQRVLMCYDGAAPSATSFTGRIIIYDGMCLFDIFRSNTVGSATSFIGRIIIYDGMCLFGTFRNNTADLTNCRHIGHLDIIEL